jgi:hypothetical protein
VTIFDISITKPVETAVAGDFDAYSIPEWCRRNSLSVSFYHKLQQQGLGPRIMRVRRRTFISREAAAEWRHARETASSSEIVAA